MCDSIGRSWYVASLASLASLASYVADGFKILLAALRVGIEDDFVRAMVGRPSRDMLSYVADVLETLLAAL